MPTTAKYLITPDPVGDAIEFPSYDDYYTNLGNLISGEARDIEASDEILEIDVSGKFVLDRVEETGIIDLDAFNPNPTNYIHIRPQSNVPFHNYVWDSIIKFVGQSERDSGFFRADSTILEDIGISDEALANARNLLAANCDIIRCMLFCTNGFNVFINSGFAKTTPLTSFNSNMEDTIIFDDGESDGIAYNETSGIAARCVNTVVCGYKFGNGYQQGFSNTTEWTNLAALGCFSGFGVNDVTGVDYTASTRDDAPGPNSEGLIDADDIFRVGTLEAAINERNFTMKEDANNRLWNTGDGITGPHKAPKGAFRSLIDVQGFENVAQFGTPNLSYTQTLQPVGFMPVVQFGLQSIVLPGSAAYKNTVDFIFDVTGEGDGSYNDRFYLYLNLTSPDGEGDYNDRLYKRLRELGFKGSVTDMNRIFLEILNLPY